MKIVTIKTPEPEKDRIATSNHTKVVTDEGAEIHGITSMDVRYRPGDAVVAQIELFCWPQEVSGVVANFTMVHPITGKKVELSAIELGDGERVEL